MAPGGPGGPALDDKTRKKMDKDAEAIKTAAKALESREKRDAKDRAKAGGYVFCASRGHFVDGSQRGDAGLGVAAVDDAVCASDAQGDLREQGSSRETTAMAARLVRLVLSCPLSAHPASQVVELEIWLQEAGQERHEHLSRRSHIRSAWHWQDDERTPVCETRGVYPDRAECQRCAEQEASRGECVGRGRLPC